MAYMLPLRFIKVGPDVSICATKIIAIMSTKCYQARQTLKSQRQSKTLINACGKLKAKTAIFLDNGTVVSSPLTIQRIETAIQKSNLRSIEPGRLPPRRLKVYDVVDEQPNPQIDQQYDQLSVFDAFEEDDDDGEEIEEE